MLNSEAKLKLIMKKSVLRTEDAKKNGVDQYVLTQTDFKNIVLNERISKMGGEECLVGIVSYNADMFNVMKMDLAKNAHPFMIILILTRWDFGMLSELSAS